MTAALVTPVVRDEEGRRISRTMRATDELQALMDFYYATVPVVPRSEGVFCYRGERLDGRRTPRCYGMEGEGRGVRVDFFLAMRPGAFVTVTVRDDQEPGVTRTMRRADPMRGLIDFYYAMTPHEEGTFINFNGRQISPEDTPVDLEMEGDEDYDIYFEPSRPNSDHLPWQVTRRVLL
ncbi:uncharacterized protein C2845_PM03G10710 [Panicum miliaceum]|uniref:Uncharacterized protein n=1 Tax=Panicum miliaceum TaxID=4540 RepID=A0A3L6T6R6_PANMI|nr:uncharacterized protein C2845_PM03G10710 [Panicum miliaceum]